LTSAPPGFTEYAWPSADFTPKAMVGPGYPPPLPLQTNSFAVAALIAGIVSILGSCTCFLAFPAAIVALSFGKAALGRVRAEPERFGGRGLAVAGIACGASGVALTFLLIVLNVAVFSGR
jgi:hypothetical protein